MKYPQVSILMPVFNAERYICTAIESIIKQSFEDFELIIVDDGSDDSSSEIIQRYMTIDPRIIVIKQANQGIVSALNNALLVASGEFCARMDADDISLKDRLAVQIMYLKEHPEYILVGGQGYMVDDENYPIGPISVVLTHEEINSALLHERSFYGKTHLIHPAVMFRTSIAKKIGGYRQEFLWAEDRDFFLRMGEAGKLANVEEIVLHYRQHGNSVSDTKSVLQAQSACKAIMEARKRRNLRPVPESLIYITPSNLKLGSYLIQSATFAIINNNRRTAFRHMKRYISVYRFNIKLVVVVILFMMPHSLIQFLILIKQNAKRYALKSLL